MCSSEVGGVRFGRSWLFRHSTPEQKIIIERPTGRGAILSLSPWDVGVLIDLWTIAISECLVVVHVFCGCVLCFVNKRYLLAFS